MEFLKPMFPVREEIRPYSERNVFVCSNLSASYLKDWYKVLVFALHNLELTQDGKVVGIFWKLWDKWITCSHLGGKDYSWGKQYSTESLEEKAGKEVFYGTLGIQKWLCILEKLRMVIPNERHMIRTDLRRL